MLRKIHTSDANDDLEALGNVPVHRDPLAPPVAATPVAQDEMWQERMRRAKERQAEAAANRGTS